MGQADLYEAHRHPAQFHLAVSVWLIRGSGEKKQILLQKRSQEKIVGAHQWGNGICGNVRPDEDVEGCATRRLREEIGVVGVDLVPAYQFEYQAFSNEEYGEHELDQVFLGRYEGDCQPNPHEVQEVIWVDLTELADQIRGKDLVGAEETLGVPTDQLQGKTPPLTLTLNGRSLELTPWTAIMLGDERLWSKLRDFE